jgi:hypothetical protein
VITVFIWIMPARRVRQWYRITHGEHRHCALIQSVRSALELYAGVAMISCSSVFEALTVS